MEEDEKSVKPIAFSSPLESGRAFQAKFTYTKIIKGHELSTAFALNIKQKISKQTLPPHLRAGNEFEFGVCNSVTSCFQIFYLTALSLFPHVVS